MGSLYVLDTNWLMVFAIDQSTRGKVSVVFQKDSSVGLTVCGTWALNDSKSQALQKSPSVYDDEVFKLDEAEKRVADLHSELARLRSRKNVASTKNSPGDDIKVVKVERRSISPVCKTEDSRQNQPQSRPQLVIPTVNPKISQPVLMVGSSSKDSNGSQFQSRKPRMSVQNNIVSKLKGNESHVTPTEPEASEVQAKEGTKRKFEQKEHKELISLIWSCSSPKTIHCQTGCYMSNQHEKIEKSCVVSTNEELFMTSALDGVVNLWQIQAKGFSANLLSLNPRSRGNGQKI